LNSSFNKALAIGEAKRGNSRNYTTDKKPEAQDDSQTKSLNKQDSIGSISTFHPNKVKLGGK
jgi:hypothetical protein